MRAAVRSDLFRRPIERHAVMIWGARVTENGAGLRKCAALAIPTPSRSFLNWECLPRPFDAPAAVARYGSF
jgi:hypothetical protein